MCFVRKWGRSRRRYRAIHMLARRTRVKVFRCFCILPPPPPVFLPSARPPALQYSACLFLTHFLPGLWLICPGGQREATRYTPQRASEGTFPLSPLRIVIKIRTPERQTMRSVRSFPFRTADGRTDREGGSNKKSCRQRQVDKLAYLC